MRAGQGILLTGSRLGLTGLTLLAPLRLCRQGAAGITTTLLNEDHPRWTPDHARAFCFPTRKPHSRLYVALFDADDMDDDDPLGRVEIPLGALYPNTVYDVWAPLQNSPFTLHMHK